MFNESVIGLISGLVVPDLLYAKAWDIAHFVATRISPVLLVVAIAIRTMTAQLDTVADGKGNWSRALRDVFVWGTVFGLYFGIVKLIGGFMSSSYTLFDSFGSLSAITDQLANAMTQLESRESDTNILSTLTGNAWQLFGAMFYYLTLVAVVTIVSFFHLAQALGFGACFIFGLIAIPLAITNKISVLRGWALFFAFILMWPIMEAISLGLIGGMFGNSINAMVSGTAGEAGWEQGSAYFLFTTLNIIIVMVIIAVPFITNALISNAPAGSALVAPFVGGALATVAGVHYANKTAANSVVKRDKDGHFSAGAIPKALGGVANTVGKSLTGDEGYSTRPPRPRVEPTFDDSPSTGGGADTGSASARSDADQARRGAIINQQQAAAAVGPEGKA